MRNHERLCFMMLKLKVTHHSTSINRKIYLKVEKLLLLLTTTFLWAVSNTEYKQMFIIEVQSILR